MKVAFVYPHWRIAGPPLQLSYAMDIVATELARRLARTCEVSVYTRAGRRGRRAEMHGGVLYRPVPVALDRLLLKSVGGPRHFLERLGWQDPGRPFGSSALFFLAYALQAALDIRNRNCDIVQVFIYDNFIPIIRRLNPQAKIVLHMHDHSQMQRDQRMVERRLRQADLIVGCSAFVTRNVAERFPAIADRCQTILNGVDIERFAAAADAGAAKQNGPRRLLFVGRLSPEKGVHVLLDAFRVVAAKRPGTELALIGPDSVAPKSFVDPFDDDPHFATLRAFFQDGKRYAAFLRGKSDPDGSTRFLGEIPNDQSVAYYRESDIFIFPSLWQEPFGLPVIEAMAAGLPVVATRAGAFPEVVEDGKTGLLVPRGDADALAAAILRLLENDALRQSMGRAARERVLSRFSYELSVERWREHYARLAAAPRPMPLPAKHAA